MAEHQADAMKQFLQDTSIHGLSMISKQRTTKFKVFWSVVVLMAFMGMFLHLYHIIDAYLQFKSTISILERKTGFPFPDVTICNLNGVSYLNLEQAVAEDPIVKNTLDNYLNLNEELKTELPTLASVFSWTLGAEDAFNLGHSLHDMVIYCQFTSAECKKEDFVPFHFPEFLNCFTFKAGRGNILTTRAGFQDGLSLVLYLEPEKNSPEDTYNEHFLYANNVGMRAHIGPPNTLAAVGQTGFDFVPGFSTSVGFDITEHKRLSEPFSTCGKTGSNSAYSFVECRNLCMHDVVLKNCDCHPTIYVIRNRTQAPSCGHYLFSNKSKANEMLACQREVLSNVYLDREKFIQQCGCLVPWDDHSYATSMSHSVWPSRKSFNSFLTKMIKNHPKRQTLKAFQYYQKLTMENVSRNEIYDWVSKHFLRLNVFSNSRLESVEEQVPLYTLADVFCQIGGCLGLWLGMSLITTIEIWDYVFKMALDVLKPQKTENE